MIAIINWFMVLCAVLFISVLCAVLFIIGTRNERIFSEEDED
jgi:hypothetical protein